MRNNSTTHSGSDLKGNAAQLEAIFHTNGPAMVLAGPGSGKTFVIVQRLKHLIEDCDIDPASILVITFTKAAAIEMQQRFMKITDSSYPEVCFGTFHSIFYQIIRRSNPNRNFKIISENDKYRILKDILLKGKAKNIISNSYKQVDETIEDSERLKEIISEISRIKNTGDELQKCSPSLPLRQNFPYIFNEYQKALDEYRMIDFDDMILQCFKLLSDNENILDLWASKFKYILIDEYQDINLMQYKVVRLLCRSDNFFVVGDDDQSIYGFRGSDPGIMQKFGEEFSDKSPKLINLNINYRCGKRILENALFLIDENKIRFKKELIANSSNGEGFIYSRRYIDKKQQTKAILQFLESQRGNFSNIAFIFRTNSEGYYLASVLKENGISTNLEEFARSFAESPAVKLCEDYLKFVYGGKKRETFFRIMNKPMRYISRDCACEETVSEAKVRLFYHGNREKLREIEKLFNQLRILSKMRPSLCIRYLRKEVGIDKLFPGEIDALNELSELSASMADNRALIEKLGEMRKLSEENNKRPKNNKGDDKVKIMTMHGAKGLEFQTVWLPNLNEGIIPSRSSVTQAQIEEERRMLYVGMTRAKTALIMSYITGTEENPMLPSRFLRPIKHLWEKGEKSYSSSPSSPSSGSSTISSNSTSSR